MRERGEHPEAHGAIGYGFLGLVSWRPILEPGEPPQEFAPGISAEDVAEIDRKL